MRLQRWLSDTAETENIDKLASGSSLGIISSLDCGSAGPNFKLVEIRFQSFSLYSRRIARPQGGSPYWRTLTNLFFLCAHSSGVYALHSPSPQQEGKDHVLPGVLLFTGPSHNPVSLASQSPVSQVFLLFPLLQRRKLRRPEVNGPAKVTH